MENKNLQKNFQKTKISKKKLQKRQISTKNFGKQKSPTIFIENKNLYKITGNNNLQKQLKQKFLKNYRKQEISKKI